MVQSRKITAEKRKSYARRRKLSTCWKVTPKNNCISRPRTCSYASGSIRQFCRKKNNTPHGLTRRRKKKASSKMNKSLRRSKRISSMGVKSYSIYR